MSLKDTLRADSTAALKARDKFTLTILRDLLSQVEKAEKGGKTAILLEDQAVQKLIRTKIKESEFSVLEYEKVGRPEIAQLERDEIALLKSYLPAELTDAELESLIAEALTKFDSPTASDFGQVMKSVVAAAEGRADGTRVSKAVKLVLA